MKVAQKVFVVTGGGNGIGRALVLALLARGARVAAVDVGEQALADTALLVPTGADRLSTHVVDVTDRAAVEALPAAVLAAHGQVDGVVSVAGIIQKFVPVADLTYAEIEKIMAVNFWGVVHMSKTFLPHLTGRPEACLVNVSSMGALAPVPGQSAYGASKAAVKLFTEGLYAELRDTPVAVTAVFPGGVATDISANSGVTVAGADGGDSSGMVQTTAPDAAAQIVAGIEKGAFRVVIGKDARMTDRMARLAPRRAVNLIADRMKSLLAPAGREKVGA
ncbi:SDR family NAD(P)-dependent oxidoreductase [Georgenia sp. TF02-10]|uniref:SDR family NAD(P)-dependent oxidoreductase n=1 Tax=Georgenia sp. TF02-10 TaxID=2917725 RepID=UPI001FA6D7AA|nr:SDR family NAD(P)-dependent oxidoreductase [Georgenia sp. TF02-10]UNX55036.1 SDR family NAD(P)-dependent oxidoreductase [Georgenia sp. TF02-10]